MAPIVTAVATLEPEMAAKIAQAKIVATPMPPVRWPSHLLPIAAISVIQA